MICRCSRSNRLLTIVVMGLLVSLSGCMRSVQIGDPALKPYDSMYSVDRTQNGFTPLPKTGTVWIEGRSLSGDYDAMLHFGGNPSRTVAFRWNGKTYQWLGEQEDFEGPGDYETPDGRFHEDVAISYYKEAADAVPKGLWIQYFGLKPSSLTLEEATPLIKKWGLHE
jgi:hypothetical protein